MGTANRGKAVNDSTITKCPSCHTAFKVTPELLNAANGTVRCGSCLKAFKATDYLLTPFPSESSVIDKDTDKEELEEIESTSTAANDESKKDNQPPPEEVYIEELLSEPEPQELLEEEAEPPSFEEDESPESLDHPSQLSTSLIDERQSQQNFPWKWFSGSLLLGVIIISQIAWLRFDNLSTRQPYSSYYAYACQWLPCQLKAPSDTQKIETSQLFVRSHTKEQNALTVDAVIINKAQFDQPFPALALEFRNIHGQAVASRHFQPEEYLHGDLRGVTLMPSEQPVQLSLHIVDPGESAVNYLLSIVDAQKMTKK